MRARILTATLLLIVLVLGAPITYSQAPQGFSYQAVVRDGSGAPIADRTVGLRITLQDADETPYYTETHAPSTNGQGVIAVTIGGGTPVGLDTFPGVPWKTKEIYIKVEIDPLGASDYTQIGAPTKLLSVPYALVAQDIKEVVSLPNALPDDPIFEVKNSSGQVVFGVYQGGVRIYVEDAQIKGPRGGFAIGGLTNQAKGQQEYFRITPDSARLYVKEVPTTKGARGGFAIGGLTNQGKGTSGNFLDLTPDNYFIGQDAGKSIVSGIYNSFMGYQNGQATTTGSSNVFIGYQTGFMNISGANNIAVGNLAGYLGTTGVSNVFLGDSAGYGNTNSYNVFIGKGSGEANTGAYNAFLGYQAGLKNTSGENNVFIGNQTGFYNTTGGYNTFLGYQAGFKNNASYNVFIGNESGKNNTSGTNNAFLGYYAGHENTTGSSNVFMGNQSGASNTSGTSNIFIGENAGYSNKTGIHNIFMGRLSGYTGTVLQNNIFIGDSSGYLSNNQFATNNVFIGYAAGKNTQSYNNIFVGNQAGWSNSGGQNNIAIGDKAGFSNTTSQNIFIGTEAGWKNTTGYFNIMMGRYAGHSNTTGYQQILIGGLAGGSLTTGNENIMIGNTAGSVNSTGTGNVYLGTAAGWSNTGSYNVIIGYKVGYGAFQTVSNRLIIDGGPVTTPLVWGEFDNRRVVINGISSNNINDRTFFVNGSAGGTGAWWNDSDERLKKNIATIPNALSKVNQLRGVNFEWKDASNPEKGVRMGFIAQETEKIIPEVVNKEGEFYSMQYAPITAVLVEAIKEQQKEIEALKAELDQIKALLKK